MTIVSFGKMMKIALAAADELAKEGIKAEVIDLRSVRPIDYDTLIESVKKTNRMVVVEEAWPLASISSELAYMVQRRAFDYLDAPVLRITCMDVPLPYAPTLIEASLPNVERTVKAVKEVMYVAGYFAHAALLHHLHGPGRNIDGLHREAPLLEFQGVAAGPGAQIEHPAPAFFQGSALHFGHFPEGTEKVGCGQHFLIGHGAVHGQRSTQMALLICQQRLAQSIGRGRNGG